MLGFAGIDNQGLMGLELYYDKELSGTEGSVKFYADAKGQRMNDMADDYEPPVNGLDLKLTIDSKIQTIVERELDNAQATYNPDGIIAIAMNPNNGEILAMSSRPSFDPANFRNVDPEVYNRNLPVWSHMNQVQLLKLLPLLQHWKKVKLTWKKIIFMILVMSVLVVQGYVVGKGAVMEVNLFLRLFKILVTRDLLNLEKDLEKISLFKYVKDFGFGEKTGIDLQGEGKGYSI